MGLCNSTDSALPDAPRRKTARPGRKVDSAWALQKTAWQRMLVRVKTERDAIANPPQSFSAKLHSQRLRVQCFMMGRMTSEHVQAEDAFAESGKLTVYVTYGSPFGLFVGAVIAVDPVTDTLNDVMESCRGLLDDINLPMFVQVASVMHGRELLFRNEAEDRIGRRCIVFALTPPPPFDEYEFDYDSDAENDQAQDEGRDRNAEVEMRNIVRSGRAMLETEYQRGLQRHVPMGPLTEILQNYSFCTFSRNLHGDLVLFSGNG